MSGEGSPDYDVLSEAKTLMENGEIHLEAANSCREAGDYDDALDEAADAREAFKNALDLVTRTDVINTGALGAEEKLSAAEAAARAARRDRLAEKVDALESELTAVERLIDRFSDDGVPMEAHDRFADLEPRFEALLESATEEDFEDLRAELTALEDRRERVAATLSAEESVARDAAEAEAEASSESQLAAEDLILETVRDDEPAGVLRYGLLAVFLLPIIGLYPVMQARRDADAIAEWYQQSPLAGVPGVAPSTALPGVLYGGALLGLVGAFSYGVTAIEGSIFAETSLVVDAASYFVVVLVGLFAGLGVVLGLARRGYKRELAPRLAVCLVPGAVVPVGFILVIMVVNEQAQSEMFVTLLQELRFSVVPVLVVLVGGLVGNGYLSKTMKMRQELKQHSDILESRSFVETDLQVGTTTDSVDELELLGEFAGSVWDAPADLAEDAEPVLARDLVAFRDITEDLTVSSRTRTKESPGTSASTPPKFKGRRAHAPDGFQSKSVTRYVSGTKSTGECPKCHGRGEVDCSYRDCHGSGWVTCSRCSGSGRDSCSSCGGSGKNSDGRTCSSCGGGGSETCSKCGGNGQDRCSRCGGSGKNTCSRCRGSGKVTTYQVVKVKYRPTTEVSYRANTVPEALLEDADGEQIHEEQTENPERGVIRRRETTEKIPVTSVIYRYLGDEWELFEIEDMVKAADYPRDFDKQFTVVQATAIVTFVALSGTVVLIVL